LSQSLPGGGGARKRQVAGSRAFRLPRRNTAICGAPGRLVELRTSPGRNEVDAEQPLSNSAAAPTEDNRPDRLESWKEIASYLRRDISTVQRWEKREGMPVHRHVHDKRGSVYAFARDLDAWWQSRGARLEEEEPDQATLPPLPTTSETAAVVTTTGRSSRAQVAIVRFGRAAPRESGRRGGCGRRILGGRAHGAARSSRHRAARPTSYRDARPRGTRVVA
jgi:hypothetical protein